jgi:hypothetical protein
MGQFTRRVVTTYALKVGVTAAVTTTTSVDGNESTFPRLFPQCGIAAS